MEEAVISKRRLVIFGTVEIAAVMRYYFAHDSAYEAVAFTVDGAYVKEPFYEGLPVVPFEELPRAFPPESHDGFVAISYVKLNELRAAKCAAMRAAGYRLGNYVSSKATTWPGLKMGDNCLILEDNTIQPFVTLGDGVTLWSGNHIGHHARIGDYSFISSHAVVSGSVTIGAKCFIGVNATLRDHVAIGDRCVIGAAAVVMADAPSETVYPAAANAPSPVPSSRLRKL